MTKRICLWSSPRNVSTAFMYSWAQRPDTFVVDEPLYGYYLKISGANHPGREEVIAAMECDSKKVIEKVFLGDFQQPVVFFKHMAHHTIDLDLSFMKEQYNLFFLRNPKQIIASYSAVIQNPTMVDVGIQKQFELYSYAKQNNFKTIVLDSGELLKNPEKVLNQLCDIIGIPFYKGMIQWPAGSRKEDGIWAKYWYANVHRTTGFDNRFTKERELPAHLVELYEQSKPFYETLFNESIKA